MNLVVNSMVSESYLESVREADQGRSAWKFVVIETPERLHFVCGPVAKFPYHANLVGRFCNQFEIGAVWEHKPDLVGILDVNIRVRGGGHMQLELVAGKLKIYGRSTAYGPYNPDHLAGLVVSNAFFKDFELLVIGL